MSNDDKSIIQENEVEIDLSLIFKKLLSKLNIILISAFTFSLVFILVTMFAIPKKYESRISLYVNVTQDERDSINMSEINASKSLVSTYMTFIKSNRVLNQVKDKLNIEDMTLKELRESISCSQINGTEFFEVRVKTTDPLLSAKIAEHISLIAPSEFENVFKSSTVVVVDSAKVPIKFCEPNVNKNAVLGAFLGFFLMSGVIMLFAILSQKVEAPNELEKRYTIPLIGIIPDRKQP